MAYKRTPVLLLHRAFNAQLERRRVHRERVRSIAVDIATELVEQQDQGKSTVRLLCPMIKLACAGPVNIVGKVFLALKIKNFVLAKPDVHAMVDLWR